MAETAVRRRSKTAVAESNTQPSVPTTPTRKAVIAAIIRESVAAGVRCDAVRAGRVIDLAQKVVSLNGSEYYLTDDDLSVNGGPHDVLAVVVPDTEPGDPLRVLQPGSAEALLTAHVMPGHPDRRLIHTSDFQGTVRHCIVTMYTF